MAAPRKRLVLCCDGTWNKADQADARGNPCPTNVIKLAYRVAKRDTNTPQILFYDQGVGTGNTIDRLSGGAFGDGLDDNILDAYRFLVANYETGDEIFLVGFSRGAFTARSIGGMIRKCGIIKRTAVNQYVPARELYHKANVHPDDAEAVAFRKNYSCCGSEPVAIKCIGVWDTVGALGIPLRGLRWLTRRDNTFHDTELSRIVQNAFQALAIDEHRAPFAPTLWDEKQKPNQRVEQVWFAGAHSDIGGGYPEHDLSDISLQWMLDRVHSAGLVLDDEVMQARPLAGRVDGTLHDSKTGFYDFTKGNDREIAFGGTQSVHASALARWDRVAAYRPKTLRAYFAAAKDPRATMK
jgi:uncharacterized protein (DUF2235 family)